MIKASRKKEKAAVYALWKSKPIGVTMARYIDLLTTSRIKKNSCSLQKKALLAANAKVNMGSTSKIIKDVAKLISVKQARKIAPPPSRNISNDTKILLLESMRGSKYLRPILLQTVGKPTQTSLKCIFESKVKDADSIIDYAKLWSLSLKTIFVQKENKVYIAASIVRNAMRSHKVTPYSALLVNLFFGGAEKAIRYWVSILNDIKSFEVYNMAKERIDSITNELFTCFNLKSVRHYVLYEYDCIFF
eukprot:NODE_54_length_30443_cov_1.442954.p17 type:complete len:247 gc:universal NODE_54_length_30443_cov_1.442954:17568-18308(+)